jgi:hypothetical protein
MMGVEIVLKSNSTKARRKMMARGVAGRNMVGGGGRVQTSVGVVGYWKVGLREALAGNQDGRWRWRVPGRRARAQTSKRSGWFRPAMEHTDGIDMGWLAGWW